MAKIFLQGSTAQKDEANGPYIISKMVHWPDTMIPPQVGHGLEFTNGYYMVDFIMQSFHRELTEVQFTATPTELKRLVEFDGFEVNVE